MQIIAEIPDELAPKIAEAFSAAYPTITAGLGPSQAIRAVFIYWARTTLAQRAADLAAAAGDAGVELAKKKRDDLVDGARKRAMLETEFLVEEVENGSDPVQTDIVD